MRNMMINVLIVDDEAYVREGLKYIIDWEKLGFVICDEAENGDEAVEKIMLYQPGMVLLDIKIPGIHGTEVIQKVRKKGFDGEIIILSGYSEFKYAQTALQYGAINYITKPVDEMKLIDAVKAVKEKIDKQNDKERSLDQYLKKAKAMVLYDLLTGREFDPTINYNELGLYASIYQVVIYENYAPYFQLNDFASLLMIDNNSFEHTQIQQREVILLKNRFALERFWAWVAHYESGYQKGSFMDSVFFVYGEAVSSIKEISRSYHQCVTLIKRRFFCGENQHMLSYKELPPNRGESEIDPALGRNYGKRLFEYIQASSRARISRTLEELREYFLQNNFEILNIRHFLVDIFLQVKQNTIHTYGNSHEIPFQNNAAVIELIENKSYLFEILDYFMEQFEIIMEHIGNNASDSVFDDAIYYINMNYASQLKLEEIAALFGYNSSYFGKLFTQKNGCNFKTYLDRLRIENSKEMLLDTDMKVYEIAARVGYNYVDIYHQKFKKLVHMSPAEFRKAAGKTEA